MTSPLRCQERIENKNDWVPWKDVFARSLCWDVPSQYFVKYIFAMLFFFHFLTFSFRNEFILNPERNVDAKEKYFGSINQSENSKINIFQNRPRCLEIMTVSRFNSKIKIYIFLNETDRTPLPS